MNKIYKVIWSKVKHQYVVVSELAHSSGKQSRTARKSLRSRIAALVVCGAIAAFGVYGALPTQQAFAAEGDETVSTAPLPGALANIEDYVAYKAESNADPNNPPDGYYLYTDPDNASIKYWVRDGFTIDLGQIKTQDGTGTSYGITNVYAPGDKGVFNEVLTNSTVVEEGMQAHRNDGTEIEGQKVQTNIGQALNQVNLGNLVGSTNAVGPNAAKVPMDYSYYIQNSRGQWVNVGLKHNPTDFYNNFKTVDNGLDYDEHTGKYYYTNLNGEKKVVDFDNIYYIDVGEEKPVAGVFVNDQGYLYEGTVWGATGEILTTAQDGDGLKTYWSAVANADDIYLKDSNLTVGELNKAFDTLETNDERLYNNDIKEITVKPGQNGGGTLGLLRNGTDENDEPVEGAITVEGLGGTGGDDTGIKFSQKDETGEDIPNSVFTINTGSRVEGIGSAPSETSFNQGSLTGLTINGQYYTVPEVTVSEDGDTVNITEGDTTDIDLITTSGEKHIATSGDTDPDNENKPYTGVYTADADGTVELTEVDGTGKPTGNTLQIKDVASKTALDKLDDLAVKYDDKNKDEITLGGLGEDGEPSKAPVAIHNVANGVDPNDAVNVSQLEKVETLAGKHTTMTVNGGTPAPAVPEGETESDYTDGNLQLKQTVTNGQIQYDVNLNDNITLGEGENQIQLNGAPKDDDTPAISVGNNFAVNHDGSINSTVGNDLQGGAKATATFEFDEHGLKVTDEEDSTSTVINGGTVTVRNDSMGNQTTISGKAINAGDIKLNSETDASTIVGLSNTTWDGTTDNDSRAATEGQLQDLSDTLDGAVMYDMNDKGTPDTNDDYRDYNSVTLAGQAYSKTSNDDGTTTYKGGTRLTNVAYADVTKTENGSDAVNVDLLKDYVEQNGGETYTASDGININENNAVSVNAGDGLGFAENADENGTKKLEVKVGDNLEIENGAVALKDNIVLTNQGSLTAGNVVISNDSIAVGGHSYITSDGIDANNQKITGVLQGDVKEGSTDAVNGDQLYDVIRSTVKYDLITDGENAGERDYNKITLAGDTYNNTTGEGGTTITNLRPGDISPTSTDAVNGSQLYTVQQEAGRHTEITVNGGVAAPDDGTYTHDEQGHLDGNLLLKQSEGTNGQTVYDLKLNPDITLQSEDDKLETQDNRVELSGSNGTIMATTDFNDMSATTTINGGNVYVGNSVSVGDKVVMTNEDITGLSNTNWDGTTDNVSRAATEGQLQTVSKDVASLNDGAVKYWKNEDGSYDKSFVQLEGGEDGTLVTHVRDGAVNEYSSDAVNGSQLWETQQQIEEVQTEAGKHTTVTVNGGMTAPEDGSYTHDENGKLDGNLLLKQTNNDGQIEYDLKLNPDLTLQGEDDSTARVEIGGTNGTIMATKDPTDMSATTTIDGGNIYAGSSITVGTPNENEIVITNKDITGLSNTNWDGTTDNVSRAATEGQLQTVSKDVASLNDGAVKYWKNEDGTYDKSFIQLEGGEEGTTITHLKDGVVAEYSTEAINGSQLWETQQQIKDVETTANKHTIVSTTDDSNLTVKNVAKEGEADNYQVTLNDEVVLGDYFDKGNGVLISGNSGTISATNSITVGEDQGLVIDGQKKTIQGLSNTTWTGTTETPNRAATEGQLQNAYDGSVKYWRNEDGTYDKSFIQLEGGEEGTTITHLKDGVVAEYSTEAINGSQLWETQQQIKDVETTANKHTIVSTTKDSNLTVKNVAGEGEADNYQVALKDDITLKGDSSSIELTGTKGTIQVNQETAEGTNFTNINGNVVSIGYTNSEGIENAIVIDGGKGTITGLSNTTWDDELAKQVANSEELQGTAATQGQLQQAVSEVSGIVNKGWTAKAGDNDGEINITPGDTLNFEGDGNITVSATGGTSNELKFGLNDNITLGDKESTSITLYTDPTSETTVVGTDDNTTNVTGYVPESYKSGTGADFVKNNGGFALFTTDTQGHGIFGVTTKGTAHGKDFVTYTKDIYGNDTRYSLNDVGDAVAQMSSYYNEENRKSYTVFSRYLNEAEKDNPFVTVDEDGNKINATRDIPLALRDDGAVLIGATIKGEDFTDNGIRINAETETTYDEDGNEVTNNIATITGLENTEWTPPAPVATFANEGTETSRAATEAQLNDLYGTVVGYNVDTDGVNYGTVTLGGGRTSYDKDTHEGGTVLNNVAYASGTDGSEAVNVDYLNDAINNAVKDGGAISDSDRHLQEGTYHVNDQGEVELIVADEKGENQSTVTIDNIANKNDITNLDNKIDNTFNDLNDKINNIDNVETDVKGGNINEDGTISLKTENEDGTTTNVTLKGQLTDSGVVQEGTSFDKETGTITITSQDKYSGETSSVKVEGIASTEVVGATNKEDLATAYKDADKDGNATTEYITDSESMVEADVALDHAIQDVAGTSYANDMVLSNRIDSVEKRLGNVEERIDKVGAMAAAIANLRTMGFDPEAPTEIAIGVGQYKSETGIAIGVFHYPNQDFMLSASLSSSGDELMGGIGATWKLGRKSAAERAKDEEARHLEQAEEMKKLAQQEKVKAQAQRHAKLLAERQQASQKNA